MLLVVLLMVLGAPAGAEAAGPKVTGISVGSGELPATHTCARRSDGTAWCWGPNGSGQVGDGTGITRDQPSRVLGLTNVTAISAGGEHTCAVRSDGSAWCWGFNAYGQLGIGSHSNRYEAQRVPGLANVTAISAGGNHTCARRSDGTAWCWGHNTHGELGDGNPGDSAVPVQVGLTDVTSISAGLLHSCARRTDGTAWCWGHHLGSLGDGTTVDSGVPVKVDLTDVAAVSAGANHSCALRTDATVWCWGYNKYGQLGDDSTTTSASPVRVVGLTGIASITTGFMFSCATGTNGHGWCWGGNAYNEIGDGTTYARDNPQEIYTGGAAGIAAGLAHACAWRTSGPAQCWGDNQYGQLGDGSGRPSPQYRVDVVFPKPTLTCTPGTSGGRKKIAWGTAVRCTFKGNGAGSFVKWSAPKFSRKGNGASARLTAVQGGPASISVIFKNPAGRQRLITAFFSVTVRRPTLSLPFRGTSDPATQWGFERGPHCDAFAYTPLCWFAEAPPDAIRDAVDFAPPRTDLCTTEGIVRAAAPGVVRHAGALVGDPYLSKSLVQIDHGGGFGTGYAFLDPTRILVRNGQRVKTGTPLGYPACEGAMNEASLHFFVCYQPPKGYCATDGTAATMLDIAGTVLGGWKVGTTRSTGWDGTLTRAGYPTITADVGSPPRIPMP